MKQVITGGNGTTGQTGEEVKDIINENFDETYVGFQAAQSSADDAQTDATQAIADAAAAQSTADTALINAATAQSGANSANAALANKADLVGGTVPANQLPSYVDDVLEFANLAAFPGTGVSGKIYVALDTNLTYRWSGSVYAVLDPSLALGETSTTAYRGDRGKTAFDHSQIVTGNPHGTTKGDLGLSLVDNTADSSKPVSTAQQTALDLKMPLPVSEAFTSVVTFDQRNKFSSTTQTGAINITLAASGNIDNSEHRFVIIGNSANTLTISSAFNVIGVLDNTKRNIIYFKYISSTVKPIAIIYTEPLVSFINDYSLSISTATPANAAILSDAGNTLDFTDGAGTDRAGSFFCWIKLNALGVSHEIMIRSSSTVAYVQFVVDPTNKLAAFFAVNASNYIGKQQTTASLLAGIWTHVGFTKSAVEANTSLTFYINGVAVAGTGSLTGTYTGVGAGGATKFGWQDAGGTVTGNFLIDDACFVDKEMSAAEMVEAYNGGFVFDKRTASFAASLLSYHSFEQNGADLTGNGHTATITTPVYSTSHP